MGFCRRLAIVALACAVGGCDALYEHDQHYQFQGTISHGETRADWSGKSCQTCGPWKQWIHDSDRDVYGFAVPKGGSVVLVVDTNVLAAHLNQLTTAAIVKAAYAPGGELNDSELRALVAENRDEAHQLPGVYPVYGDVTVQRWDSLSNYSLSVAGRANDPKSTRIDGVFSGCLKREFQPLRLLWVPPVEVAVGTYMMVALIFD
jgi:hypothetical protein